MTPSETKSQLSINLKYRSKNGGGAGEIQYQLHLIGLLAELPSGAAIT